MGGRGGSPSPSALGQAQKKAAAPSAETRIREVYFELARYEGDWVPLADVRIAISDLSREQQDSALESLARQADVHLIRWDNVKVIRERDRLAAFHFGGDDNHVIRIER